jgi:enamine deaminase RidA (YjgF/YER057c/UK114 family)
MAMQRINPEGLLTPRDGLNAHVVVGSGRMALINGQVALDADGALVGGEDLSEQAAQCWRNLRVAASAVGATTADIGYYRIYVVDPGDGDAWRVIQAGQGVLGDEWPVCGAVFAGVTALGRREYLVEIEATIFLTHDSGEL